MNFSTELNKEHLTTVWNCMLTRILWTVPLSLKMFCLWAELWFTNNYQVLSSTILKRKTYHIISVWQHPDCSFYSGACHQTNGVLNCLFQISDVDNKPGTNNNNTKNTHISLIDNIITTIISNIITIINNTITIIISNITTTTIKPSSYSLSVSLLLLQISIPGCCYDWVEGVDKPSSPCHSLASHSSMSSS